MNHRVSAKRWLQRGRAGNYISNDNIQSGERVVLWCRVSGCQQNHNRNLTDQETKLREHVESKDAWVVAVVRFVGSGRDPYPLAIAADVAARHGAKILAESTSRFIRHPAYDSKKNPKAQARTTDLEDLSWWTDGVELVTILHPDASPGDERSFQTKRGQRSSGKSKGGRPMQKKRIRRQFKPIAIQMRREGKSLNQIANELKIPRSTIQDWVRGI